jgi:predicted transcriptional regulator
MTELLTQAFDTVRTLPPATQDRIARVIFCLAENDEAVYPLTAEEQAAIESSRAAAARGEFATDEQISAIWKKYGQ